jgi:hypothetical protein
MLRYTGMFAVCGFVVWDRRTALLPIINEMKQMRQREEKVDKVFQEYALKNT